MFDLLIAAQVPPLRLVTGERTRPDAPPPTRWLAQMLDEVDYGMVLLAEYSNVLHSNHVARTELEQPEHPLQMLGQTLRVRRAQDVVPLHAAVAEATTRGLRRLLTLGADEHRISLAVVPLATGAADGNQLALLVFGKRAVGGPLAVQCFARSHHLSPAECRVLAGLCDGCSPRAIADAQCVALSTVRTQVGSIKEKTGTRCVRDLLLAVAALPPLVPIVSAAG